MSTCPTVYSHPLQLLSIYIHVKYFFSLWILCWIDGKGVYGFAFSMEMYEFYFCMYKIKGLRVDAYTLSDILDAYLGTAGKSRESNSSTDLIDSIDWRIFALKIKQKNLEDKILNCSSAFSTL